MKRFFHLLILMIMALSVRAQLITEQQAQVRILQYLNQNSRALARGKALAKENLKGTKVDAKRIYAFNIEGGGYVIASADTRALPLLGYSDTGGIDWERLPANMQSWLKGYDDAIATLEGSDGFTDGNYVGSKATTRATRTAIKPMLKTTWNQMRPYWNEIPLYDGADKSKKGMNCPVGCTAAAMAQIMNYHQWPKEACAEIPAYDLITAHENVTKKWHFDKLPPVTFNWAKMLDAYVVIDEETREVKVLGTETEQKAVATLMHYCGQSVEMVYDPDGSGAGMQEAAEALVKYFGYDTSLRDVNRINYSIDEWENLVYSELAAGRPVQYSGYTDEGGHAFVCDGCDANGLFHINWGWDGLSDGYFSLSVLNPEQTSGTGASNNSIGYSIQQDILIGVKPAEEMVARTTASPSAYLEPYAPIGVFQPDSVYFRYYFNSFSYKDVKVDFALGTCDANGKLTPLFRGDIADSIVYVNDLNYHEVKIDSATIKPGEKLTLYPMVKFRSIQGCDWQMLGSKEFCVQAGRSARGRFYLYRQIPDLEITDIEVTNGTGRIGVASNYTFTIKNKSNFECTIPLPVIPYYFGDVDVSKITSATPYTEGDPIWCGAYLRAGKETRMTYSFKPQRGGIVDFLLCMPDGTYLYDGAFKIDNVMGCYDDYVNNESSYTLTEAYTDDYQTVTYSDNTNLRPGKGVYNVVFADNTEQTVPNALPSKDIYVVGRVCNPLDSTIIMEKNYEDAYNYLKDLPSKAGKGNYKLSYELPFDIRHGGIYIFWSYFNEWLDEEHKTPLLSSELFEEVEFFEDPCICVSGDTIVPSGQRLNLEIHLSSGYPYEPESFSGNEEVRYTLYEVRNGGQLKERSSEKMRLSFSTGNPYLAAVDTIKVTSELPDGKYLLRINNDWTSLGPRDINISVGGSTGISNVGRDSEKDSYVDLQGRRMSGRPLRKGVFLRNGRKEIVR